MEDREHRQQERRLSLYDQLQGLTEEENRSLQELIESDNQRRQKLAEEKLAEAERQRLEEINEKEDRRLKLVEQSPDAARSLSLGLGPKATCGKCTEETWVFVAISPNGRAAKWKCEFCGSVELVVNREEARENDPLDRHISAEVRREVWRRDHAKCAQCGSNERLEFDHIIPVSKGGANTARNVRLLCETCNRTKGDRIDG